MARKSKIDAAGPDGIRKPRAAGKPPTAKLKRTALPKKRAMQRTGTQAAPALTEPVDPTLEQIQMRAYFISERRRRFDLPGDANSDWLEAKRQLLAESRH